LKIEGTGTTHGQHINKVSTRVTLWFDVVTSLSQEQRDLVMRRLASRIGKSGVLRVISQQTRSQAANKELAIERFVELLRYAVRQVPLRKKTRVSRRPNCAGWRRRKNIRLLSVNAPDRLLRSN